MQMHGDILLRIGLQTFCPLRAVHDDDDDDTEKIRERKPWLLIPIYITSTSTSILTGFACWVGCIPSPTIFEILCKASVPSLFLFLLTYRNTLQNFIKFDYHLGGPPST